MPDPVARVNGRPIPAKTVSMVVEPVLKSGRIPPDQKPAAYRQALEQLVLREVLLQEAEAGKIGPDETLVERDFKKTRDQFKTEQEWTSFLSAQGFDVQTFRTELRIRYTVDAVLTQRVGNPMYTVTDQEAKAFYDGNPKMFETPERVRASHILLKVPEGSGPDVKASQRAKAEAALARVRKGENFAAVAKQISQDTGSAVQGGDLGTFGRGQMVPPFEQAAFALKPGQVSEVFESQYGFHIVKVFEHAPVGQVPFEPVKAQIKDHLAQARREKAVNDFLGGLKAKAKIETYL
jgi:peptidyl-prolyl cis-trans isomerase C